MEASVFPEGFYTDLWHPASRVGGEVLAGELFLAECLVVMHKDKISSQSCLMLGSPAWSS